MNLHSSSIYSRSRQSKCCKSSAWQQQRQIQCEKQHWWNTQRSGNPQRKHKCCRSSGAERCPTPCQRLSRLHPIAPSFWKWLIFIYLNKKKTISNQPWIIIFKFHSNLNLGDVNQVRKLIAQGADVNANDIHNNTPLHRASMAGNFHSFFKPQKYFPVNDWRCFDLSSWCR